MTQTNRQTPTQSGAKATAKLTASSTAKPIETRRITHAELMASIEASREKIQPVLDYLKDK